MKILIVDDDERRRDALAQHLVGEVVPLSSDIDIASCADDARRMLRAKYYDALVLDVVLPRRRGDAKVSHEHGLGLLFQLNREAFLKKPEKIIGITARIDDIASFRARFEECCSVVVEAREDQSDWRTSIKNALYYTASSKLSRLASSTKVTVFTIHGIRTYGAWQSRLQKLLQKNTDEIEFYNYKYGYFSSLSFLIPAFRNREVEHLKSRLEPLLSDLDGRRVYVFSHSFGTYLAAHAVKRSMASAPKFDVQLVLSGSVLSENFDWGFIRPYPNISVVNDCGSGDFVLYLSKMFALGLGMAGKVGFNGFNDRQLINRYFAGGHSHYFEGDKFMSDYWLPLIVDGSRGEVLDLRGEPNPVGVLGDGFARFMGSIKVASYGVISLLAIVLLYAYFFK